MIIAGTQVSEELKAGWCRLAAAVWGSLIPALSPSPFQTQAVPRVSDVTCATLPIPKNWECWAQLDPTEEQWSAAHLLSLQANHPQISLPSAPGHSTGRTRQGWEWARGNQNLSFLWQPRILHQGKLLGNPHLGSWRGSSE